MRPADAQCDGFDYFAVSVTMTDLAHYFNKSNHDISTAITLTLLFRSLGAFLFGIAADRFGRKWTLFVNLLMIAALELGSGFVQTYSAFLGVRSIFGIVMGGIWGTSAAIALENVPPHARGLMSGMMQQGYAVGYLLAASVNFITPHSKYGWRCVYFFGAGFSLLAALLRLVVPESKQYIEARERAKAEALPAKEATRRFGRAIWDMLKTNWVRTIWAICCMTGFNFLSHGSQDLYPTYLKETKMLSPQVTNRAVIISNVGAVCGGTIAGYLSQYSGRRLTGLIFLCITAAFIPLWILPGNFSGLSAGGFWMQFGVQGAWGIVPIYLSEVSPPAFRALFGGLSYQLGNMASSGAAQIETDAGDSIQIPDPKKPGKMMPDYATVQGILIGAVIAWLMVFLFLGPEADGSHFEHAKAAYEEGAGVETTTRLVHEDEYVRRESQMHKEEREAEKAA